MPGLVPGIHVFPRCKTWMAGTSPAMTECCHLAGNISNPPYEESSWIALPQHHVALEQELLRALAGVDLGREHVALRVDREIVHPVEFAGAAAVAAEGAEHLAGLARERAHFVV